MTGPHEMTGPPHDDDEAQPYTLVMAPGARRALSEGLPAPAAFAAWEFIRGPLVREPYRVGAPLQAPFDGLWRARRGEYRVRYRIDDKHHEVHVLDVDHRRDAYRR
ncbi:MAG TPA: type II toxin-antitoxin system RelE/ParE family toxin [Micromonosporaceae bacterium]|nr:type II toxin-antitoxin system RelE/ParE family toxin [Micromonosporaceae bacterium]